MSHSVTYNPGDPARTESELEYRVHTQNRNPVLVQSRHIVSYDQNQN